MLTTPSAPTAPASFKNQPRYGRWIVQIVIVLLVVVWLVPFWSELITPMKTTTEYFNSSPWAFAKDPANIFHNLQIAWQTSGLESGFLASLSYGLVGSALAIFFASLGAFAITRLTIWAPFFWFMLVFTGTIVPFQMYLIPLFQAYNNLGLYDTWIGMVAFYTAIAIPFSLFVLRGSFSTISREIMEAARLDGCRDFDVYWRICMPLSRGAIAALFLFQFTWIWNDLIFGLVLSISDGVRPVMPTLAGMQGIYATTGPPTVLSAALISSMPTLILFLLLRNYLIKGLTLTVGAE
jgi:ABC-type glycerol-3-phosphate transport system permease component